MIFDFNTQLVTGDKGEDFFIKCYQSSNARKSDTKKFDLFVNDSDSVELKTDTYAMAKSPNFFMEQYGNLKRQPHSVGGAWRAKRDNVNFFVYLFMQDRAFFWFNPITLCEHLDKNLENYEKRFIRNKTYTGLGFLVSRKSVSHLCVQADTFNKNCELLLNS